MRRDDGLMVDPYGEDGGPYYASTEVVNHPAGTPSRPPRSRTGRSSATPAEHPRLASAADLHSTLSRRSSSSPGRRHGYAAGSGVVGTVATIPPRHVAASSTAAPSQYTQGGGTVSKVTRSKSLTSKPGGIPFHHQHPHEVEAAGGSRISTLSYPTSGQKNNTTKAGVVIETMSAPNPVRDICIRSVDLEQFCPNTRGVCCLMILVNLALILISIGFIIVLQLPEPPIVWNIGIVVLVFGFIALFVALLYCMCICQEGRQERPPWSAGQPELFWTHHWQKNIAMPEIKNRGEKPTTTYWEEDSRFPDDDDDRDDVSDTSSRDYPKLYLESDYGQRTDREADMDTELEQGGPSGVGGGSPTNDRRRRS